MGQKLYDLVDSWNFPIDNNTLFIWCQGDKESGIPLGFIAFRFDFSKEYDNGHINAHIFYLSILPGSELTNEG